MAEATRWAAGGLVSWEPLLTFTRRRLALLDWFEEHTRPVAFTDTPDHTGVAIGTKDQRLRVDRGSLRLSLTAPSASVASLDKALGGVWQCLRPQQAQLTFYRGSWSLPVAADYEPLRQRLALRAAGGDVQDGLIYDFATLLSVRTPEFDASVEFGIVNQDELATRLSSDSQLSLMGQVAPREARREFANVDQASLPSVSLFADVNAVCRLDASEHHQVTHAFVKVERRVAQLVSSLGDAL